jgi:rod shape-determining protein MreC
MPGPSGFTRRHRTGVSFALLVLACVLMILFSNRNVVVQPKRVGQSFFGLFQVGFHAVGSWFRDTWNSIGELQRLREELDSARERLAEYERVSRDLADLRRENDALRAQLGFAQTIPFQYLPAQVVARDPGNLFATLVIDRGSHHGVEAGMTVVAFQRGRQGLVGKVVLVGLATSTVQPITDPECFVAARLATSRFDGLVSGSAAKPGTLVMSYVRKLALGEVQYGELVVTSGMGRLYPEGIHIGRVREMTARGYEASLELEVEPIVDLSRLEYVFVLKTGAK